MVASGVPQAVPVPVMADVAATMLVSGGVNAAAPVQLSPGLSVTPPSGVLLSKKIGLEGVPTVSVVGAFPRLAMVTGWDVGWATSDVGKLIALEPAFRTSVAPEGVTNKGTTRLGRLGSLVVRFSDPVSGMPAAAEPGTATATVNLSCTPVVRVNE